MKFFHSTWMRWGLTGAAAFVTAVWLASGWYRFMVVRPTWAVGFQHGFFGFSVGTTAAQQQGISFYKLTTHPVWDLKFSCRIGTNGTWIACSTWAVALAAAFIAGTAWLPMVRARLNRAKARLYAGLCPSCGYDLCGLGVASPCPECASSRGAVAFTTLPDSR